MAPKSRRERGRSLRQVERRAVRRRFLIVCEGAQTEPNYFRGFHVAGLVIKTAHSTARGRQLIEDAERLRADDDFDQVWCVFDRDELTFQQIDEAFQHARRMRIGVAFSNQSFELWLLLHFDHHNTPIARHEYAERLSRRLKQPYTKTAQKLYEQLLPHQKTAIANAHRLLTEYPGGHPANNNPSTTVHQLVEQLNRCGQQ
jgi:hypothetical protein